jgi:hypothetical protein
MATEGCGGWKTENILVRTGVERCQPLDTTGDKVWEAARVLLRFLEIERGRLGLDQ